MHINVQVSLKKEEKKEKGKKKTTEKTVSLVSKRIEIAFRLKLRGT